MRPATFILVMCFSSGCSALLDLEGFEYENDADVDADVDGGVDSGVDSDVDGDVADAADADAPVDAPVDALFDVSADVPDAGPPSILSYRAGDFSRETEASYIVRPAAGLEVVWASADERRFQVPATGGDAQLLLEGNGMNLASEAALTLRAPPWDYQMAADPVLGMRDAPDGTSADGFVNVAGVPNRPRRVPGGAAEQFTVSIFSHRGMGESNLVLRGPPRMEATLLIDDRPIGWKRYSATWRGPDAQAYQIQIANGQNIGATTTGMVGDLHYWWGAQIEDGLFPTSFIRSPTGVRAFDRLVFEETSAGGILDAFELDVWPSFGSADMADRAFVLFSLGGGADVLRLVNGRLEYVAEGMVVAQTEPLDFARAELLHVIVDHGVRISIRGEAGIRTADWVEDAPAWSPGFEFLRVGAVHFDSDAIDAWFGLVGEPTPL